MRKNYFYHFIKLIITPLFRLVFRPVIKGLEYIPKTEKCILAGNHTHFLDCILLMSASKRTIHFLAKKELVTGPFGFIFKSLAIIPVDRSKHNPDAVATAESYLNQNKVIGIFPEGTINRTTDVIMSFKLGAVRIANNTNSPIIPFVITGKYKLFRKSVTLTFLKPFSAQTNNLERENKILENKIIELLQKENS